MMEALRKVARLGLLVTVCAGPPAIAQTGLQQAASAGRLAIARPAAMSALLAPAQAPEAEGYKMWRGSAGVFIPTDTPDGFTSDLGFTVALDRYLRRDTAHDILVGLRYARYGAKRNLTGGRTANADVDIFYPNIAYHWLLGAERRYYVGVGVGISILHSAEGDSNTNFAGDVGVGYDLDWGFVEAKILGGTKRANQGVALSVGARF